MPLSIGSGAQICPVIQSIGMRPEWRAESQPSALLILFDIAYHAAGLLPHLSDSNSGCTNEDASPRHLVDSCGHCTLRFSQFCDLHGLASWN